ncbi:MAG TPA: DUF2231 domain-containing protein [Syntrophales bacterium]|nr:DUF2231 domain-containing protein [Syntrophales bacterium]
MKEFDSDTLAQFNGQDGRPVYIAYRGKVFDVRESKLWAGGLHMKRHYAARDLSVDIEAAPHGEEVFERYPQVGILKEKTKSMRAMPAILSSLIARYPFLQRHPHPMIVHFPIVFFLSAVFFNILYLLYCADSFKSTAMYCLIGGLLFMPVAMLTGFFTWWLNYMARPVKAVTLKIILSCILLAAASGTLFWTTFDPAILESQGIPRIMYFALILSFAPLVSAVGWLGATLTFPIEKNDIKKPITQTPSSHRVA